MAEGGEEAYIEARSEEPRGSLEDCDDMIGGSNKALDGFPSSKGVIGEYALDP